MMFFTCRGRAASNEDERQVQIHDPARIRGAWQRGDFEMYRLMKVYTGLTTVNVLVDATPERKPTSFVFDTPNLGTALASAKNVEKVLVLIHSTGAV
jgi:hypothetical protein